MKTRDSTRRVHAREKTPSGQAEQEKKRDSEKRRVAYLEAVAKFRLPKPVKGEFFIRTNEGMVPVEGLLYGKGWAIHKNKNSRIKLTHRGTGLAVGAFDTMVYARSLLRAFLMAGLEGTEEEAKSVDLDKMKQIIRAIAGGEAPEYWEAGNG